MAEDIELRLVARNEEYIQAIRQAQDANARLYREAKEGAAQEKRHIEDIRRSIDQLRVARDKSGRAKDQEVYNKKIREANIHLKEAEGNLKKYEGAQEQANKQMGEGSKASKLLNAGMIKLMGAIGGVVGIYKAFQKILASTKHSADALAIAKAGLSAQVDVLAKSIATLDFNGLRARMGAARDAARAYAAGMAEIGDEYRSLGVIEAKHRHELQGLQADMRDMSKSEKERSDALKEYQKIRGGIITEHIRISEKEMKLASDNIAKRVGLEGEELKSFIENYNNTRNIREEALNFQNQIDEEGKRAREQYQKLNYAGMETHNQRMDQQHRDHMQEYKNTLIQQNDDLGQFTSEQLQIYLDYLQKYGSATDDQLDMVAKATIKHSQAMAMEADDRRELVRVETRLHNEREAANKQAEAERLKSIQEFHQEMAKLEDAVERQRIEKLTGLERIKAEEQYALAQIQKLKENLEERFALEAEHYQLLETLIDNVEADFAQQRADHHAQRLNQQRQQRIELAQGELAYKDEYEKLLWDIALAEADIIDETGAARLRLLKSQKMEEIVLLELEGDEMSLLRARLAETELKDLDKKLEDITGGAEKGIGGYIAVLKAGGTEVANFLGMIYSQEVDYWARQRSIMDTRIAENQRMVSKEIDAHKRGYASRIAMHVEESAKLQEARDAAMAKEEEAIKRRQRLDMITQAINMGVTVTELWKSNAKVPVVGIGLALAATAAFFLSMRQAKRDASKLARTTLAKGGSGSETGLITGKSHGQGGEKFLDHVEVEKGEAWGVLSASKVPKYAGEFHSIVDAMNKGIYKPKFQVNVPRDKKTGKPTELLAIRDGINKLNRYFTGKEEIIQMNGYRIIKRGNLTRRING